MVERDDTIPHHSITWLDLNGELGDLARFQRQLSRVADGARCGDDVRSRARATFALWHLAIDFKDRPGVCQAQALEYETCHSPRLELSPRANNDSGIVDDRAGA